MPCRPTNLDRSWTGLTTFAAICLWARHSVSRVQRSWEMHKASTCNCALLSLTCSIFFQRNRKPAKAADRYGTGVKDKQCCITSITTGVCRIVGTTARSPCRVFRAYGVSVSGCALVERGYHAWTRRQCYRHGHAGSTSGGTIALPSNQVRSRTNSITCLTY